MKTLKELREERDELLKKLKEAKDTITVEERVFTADEIAANDATFSAIENVEKEILAVETMNNTKKIDEVTKSVRFDNWKHNTVGKTTPSNVFRAWVEHQAGHSNRRLTNEVIEAGYNPYGKEIRFAMFDQSVGTTTEGGYATTENPNVGFEKHLANVGSLLSLCNVIRTTDGNLYNHLYIDDTSNKATVVAEKTAVGNTSAVFSEIVFNAYKIHSGIFPVTNALISDSRVDMLGLLNGLLADRIQSAIEYNILNGGGTAANPDEPNGLVNYDANFVDASTGLDTADVLKLFHSVPFRYRSAPNAAFVCHDSVVELLAGLKDDNDNYIFIESLSSAEPSTLLGKPIIVSDHMDDVSGGFTDDVPYLWFGDWSKVGVRLVNEIRFKTSSELYWKEDALAVMAVTRMDSALLNTNAMKALAKVSGS